MLKKAIVATVLIIININASEIRYIDPFYNPANNLITAASYTSSLDGFTVLTSVNKNIYSGELTIHAKKYSAIGDKGGKDIAAEITVIDRLKSRIVALESTIRSSSSARQRVQADYLAEKASRPFGPRFFGK